MKKPLAIVAVLAAIVAAIAFWLSGNLDGLVKDAISRHGSAMTGSRVEVGDVQISPSSGKGSIRDLLVGNPAGYKTSHALKVARIDVDIDVASIARDVVIIRRIAIEAPDVIYEKGEHLTNFDAIQKNIATYLGSAAKDKRDSGPKLIVEELTVSNARASASAAFLAGKAVTVTLPDITLRNVGKARGGVTPGELGQEVTAALKSRLSASVNFDRLLKSTGQALDKAGESIKGLFK